MNKLDKDYQSLLQDILDNGHQKGDRTGTGTISVFGRQIRHRMSDGFPLITTKKMYWNGIVTELVWFLRGDTNIKFLVDNNCHIWDGDAYQSYCKQYWELDERSKIEYGSSYYNHETNEYEFETYSKEEFVDYIKTDDEFAKKWGELGPIYGKQWRSWETYDFSIDNDFGNNEFGGGWNVKHIDQIANSLNLLKTDPDSRRNKVSAWNVGEMDQMTLPPCHTDFQFYTRELSFDERINLLKNLQILQERRLDNAPQEMVSKLADSYNIPTRAISLMWNQRSVDTFLGLPFNIASYGLLLEIIAKAVNMVPDQLIGNLGDTHLYSNHIEQAREQIGREMTWEEQVQWVMKNTDVEMENLYITEEVFKDATPKHTREPYPLPTLNINTEWWPREGEEGPLNAISIFEGFKDENFCRCLLEEDIQLSNYQSHPTIKAPLSN